MSRAGEEMMLELHQLLNKQGLVSTAAKKDDDDKKDEKKEEAKKEEEDKKDEKKEDKKDKKASVMMGVIQDLVKLAEELDDAGAEEASLAVDDALKTIVDSLETPEE